MPRAHRLPFTLIVAALVAALAAAGCATKKYVRTEVGSAESRAAERMGEMETQIEETQTRLGEQEEQLGELSKTAREALDRAVAAGRLAEGKVLYETLLTDDQVRFGFESSELSAGAEAALDDFAAGLQERNENVFVEIQGHTDSTGSDQYNLELGGKRAEAVRRYLNLRHGLPLHRMSVISYGESEPIADNATREGRSTNRRVVLVVLK